MTNASEQPSGLTPDVTRPSRLLPMLAGAIVVLGALLRFWHLDAGIPYALGIDEPQIMNRAVHMMKTGDFNPHFFDWPSLTIYLQFVVSCITFLAGAMHGAWSRLDQVDASHMYAAGRMLTALAGSATVWLVYLAARRWSAAHAIVAAAVMAVIPSHVRESHYVLADVPAAFLVTLGLLLTLRARERLTLGAFALAGLAAGLAASAKYNGMVVIVLPLAAAAASPGALALRAQRAGVVATTAVAAFLLGTPYALLDLPAFLNDYARLAAIFARDRAGEPGWSIYLKHLKLTLGWPALLLGFAGLGLSLWRVLAGPDRLRWLLVAAFSLIYFQVMAGSYQIYGRYLVPLFPFVSILVAAGVVATAGALRRPFPRVAARTLVTAVAVAALAQPAWNSIAFDRGLGRVSTVDQAYLWIAEHVPAGSKVVIEQHAFTLPGTRFDVVDVLSLVTRRFEDYVADDVDYFVASSEGYGEAFTGRAPDAFTAYQTLFTRADEVASFSASAAVRGPDLKVFRIRR